MIFYRWLCLHKSFFDFQVAKRMTFGNLVKTVVCPIPLKWASRRTSMEFSWNLSHKTRAVFSRDCSSRDCFSRWTFLEVICLLTALISSNNLCVFTDRALFIFLDVCHLLFCERWRETGTIANIWSLCLLVCYRACSRIEGGEGYSKGLRCLLTRSRR